MGRASLAYAEVNVCWAGSEDEARRTVFERWPIAGIKGQLSQELPLPSHFGQAHEMLQEDDVVSTVACGPDPEVHLAQARRFIDAGYTHIWFHQIGEDQGGFLAFYEREIIPRLR